MRGATGSDLAERPSVPGFAVPFFYPAWGADFGSETWAEGMIARMSSTTAEAQLHGDWRITSTELWDGDALDLVQPAFLRFEEEHMGRLGMIAISGGLHCYYSERDGKAVVEFTWEGDDDGDARSGRGWAALDPDGVLRGRFFIHLGDDSAFDAARPTAEKPSRPTRRARGRSR
jgi:hypothetical protein